MLKHVPDEWQLVTITRHAAVDDSPAAKDAELRELFDDPADRAFPDEADNVEEVFDVLFPGNVHVHFWTFKRPPAKEHIIGNSPAAGDVRGIPTWAHPLGRLAIPQPRVVVASENADWLQTVLLEGMVRMRPAVSPPDGDLSVQINLEHDNPAYAEMCTQLAALGSAGPGKPAGIRRLGLGFRFRDPASVSVEFTAESRALATEFQRHLADGAGARKEKVEALVAAGVIERETSEHKALLAAVAVPPRVAGERVTMTMELPLRSVVTLAQFALKGDASGAPAAERQAGPEPVPPDAPHLPGHQAARPKVAHGTSRMHDLDEALAALRGGDRLRQMDAARYIGEHIPDADRHAEVVGALVESLKSSDRKSDTAVGKALEIVVVENDVPLLLEALGSQSQALRRAALAALGRFPTRETAAAAADVLIAEPALRHDAGDALKLMGAAAEPAVIPLLADRDRLVKIEACHILRVIGTQESLVPLKHALNDRMLARHARDALTAIERRE